MASTPGFEDDVSTKGVHKRYESLTTVRSKAIKGKGAWYWPHLDPILKEKPYSSVNLPNGTNFFRKAVFTTGSVPSNFAEEILWDSVNTICNGGVVQRCIGIVADRFKAKALRNLESENHWMELDQVGLIRVLPEIHFSSEFSGENFSLICPTLEDIMATTQALQLAIMDVSFKLLCSQDPLAREVAYIIGDMGFWNELEAILSLT
ncbi:hypothetical protein AMTR_s00125p00050870 [Amborella trichopoda]|uniref:DUF7963 domain-containing protein n=1 Tax=Amborella trichopoda TaxID=13333 RepID=W1NNQ7_AMBTC|nr:hypothetical protein AMTR_s00125p00050870 [Amborella trichopoda]